MAKGTVKWFNPTKGYGFIQPQSGGKDVFVHISAVERAGLSTLNEGQIVSYEIVSNRGKESAENLKVGGCSSGRRTHREHDPAKPAPGLTRCGHRFRKKKPISERSCASNKPERDDDSKRKSSCSDPGDLTQERLNSDGLRAML